MVVKREYTVNGMPAHPRAPCKQTFTHSSHIGALLGRPFGHVLGMLEKARGTQEGRTETPHRK